MSSISLQVRLGLVGVKFSLGSVQLNKYCGNAVTI